MHKVLAILATALVVVTFALPIANALAHRSGSWAGLRSQVARRIGMGTLHLAHFDTDVRPSRWQRRAMSPKLFSFYMLADESGAVTLAQAKLNAADDVDRMVIDEFRKSSFLLDSMPFDDVVNPAGGGATLTYGYQRLITQPTAAPRAINAEYVPQEVTRQQYVVDLKPFGGSYQIDRVLADIGPAAASEVALQNSQKIKAARSLFHDLAINGDSAVDANQFDGLNKALVGTTTEFGAAAGPPYIDLSTSALRDSNGNAFIDLFEEMLGSLNERPDVIATNSKGRGLLVSLARRMGYKTAGEDAFGRKIETYDGIPIVDLGDKPGSANPIVPVYTSGAVTGMIDIYAVHFGIADGFHGVSRAGAPLVQNWLPDFTTAGAVKTGEVEMVAAVALKASKAAGVLRRIKVQ